MVTERVLDTYRRIKALEIRGARRIAIAAMNALVDEIKSGGDPLAAAKLLASSRPTEPAMRKALARVLRAWETGGAKTAEEEREKILAEWELALSRLAENGKDVFEDVSLVVTHCHSTELMAAFARSSRDFTVVVTETRPKYQGKITAKELLDLGFDVVYVVDSAAWHYLERAEAFVMGVDAVEWSGSVITKVGAAMMALAAKRFETPSYFFTTTFKFDPLTKLRPEPIEFRDPKEVIDPQELPGARIENPAFDRVPSDLVSGIVTERGILAPTDVKDYMDESLLQYLERLMPNR